MKNRLMGKCLVRMSCRVVSANVHSDTLIHAYPAGVVEATLAQRQALGVLAAGCGAHPSGGRCVRVSGSACGSSARLCVCGGHTGLLRPQIVSELGLETRGFKYLTRDPSSFTPTRLDSAYGGKSLILGSDSAANAASIAQFSQRDAEAFEHYEAFLGQVGGWRSCLPGLGTTYSMLPLTPGPHWVALACVRL
jgi:hypothetical protein